MYEWSLNGVSQIARSRGRSDLWDIVFGLQYLLYYIMPETQLISTVPSIFCDGYNRKDKLQKFS